MLKFILFLCLSNTLLGADETAASEASRTQEEVFQQQNLDEKTVDLEQPLEPVEGAYQEVEKNLEQSNCAMIDKITYNFGKINFECFADVLAYFLNVLNFLEESKNQKYIIFSNYLSVQGKRNIPNIRIIDENVKIYFPETPKIYYTLQNYLRYYVDSKNISFLKNLALFYYKKLFMCAALNVLFIKAYSGKGDSKTDMNAFPVPYQQLVYTHYFKQLLKMSVKWEINEQLQKSDKILASIPVKIKEKFKIFAPSPVVEDVSLSSDLHRIVWQTFNKDFTYHKISQWVVEYKTDFDAVEKIFVREMSDRLKAKEAMWLDLKRYIHSKAYSQLETISSSLKDRIAECVFKEHLKVDFNLKKYMGLPAAQCMRVQNVLQPLIKKRSDVLHLLRSIKEKEAEIVAKELLLGELKEKIEQEKKQKPTKKIVKLNKKEAAIAREKKTVVTAVPVVPVVPVVSVKPSEPKNNMKKPLQHPKPKKKRKKRKNQRKMHSPKLPQNELQISDPVQEENLTSSISSIDLAEEGRQEEDQVSLSFSNGGSSSENSLSPSLASSPRELKEQQDDKGKDIEEEAKDDPDPQDDLVSIHSLEEENINLKSQVDLERFVTDEVARENFYLTQKVDFLEQDLKSAYDQIAYFQQQMLIAHEENAQLQESLYLAHQEIAKRSSYRRSYKGKPHNVAFQKITHPS